MAAVLEAVRIGRFDILGTLGRGAQGTVYLARDTRLNRRVAVKTLRLDRVAEDKRAHETEVMLGEARIVGQLSHPNIVALFDAGEEDGLPYLVFEYVEGETLAGAIRAAGTLAPAAAVRIASMLLAGIDYAHEAGVVHRDLKPANIMMTRDDVPRIMDFGIASHLSQAEAGKTGDEGLSGTPSYLAPEYLSGAPYTPRCDVFAAGMVLYEMLTGSPAVKGENNYQTMFAMVKEDYARPSTKNPAVDERLEAIVMRALEKDPQARYPSASAMIDALAAYANPQSAPVATKGTAESNGVLEFLMRRMRYKSDFPALSTTISTINKLVSTENGSTSALADSIIRDVSLTNKLLRMVNTAYFTQFGGAVSTVSRAVSILGVQKVRNVALSLTLFEHLQNRAQASDLKDQATSGYFSGFMARELVAKMDMPNAEEAFICAMFHRLGRLLAVFYLHEESGEVARLAEARGIPEDEAALEVIGLSYTDLGLGVARQWNLPERIIASMKTAPPSGITGNEEAKLCAVAELSNRLATVVVAPNKRARANLMRAIETDYGRALDLDAAGFNALLGAGAQVFCDEAKSLGMAPGASNFMRSVHALRPGVGAKQADGASTAPQDAAMPTALAHAGLAETVLNVGAPDLLGGAAASPAARARMLTAGIADITSTLAGEYQLNDVLRIILETMYRAIGFTRVMLCTRDPRTNSLRARLGFGDGVEALIKGGFHVPLEPAKDVFWGAISKEADICIDDRDADKVRAYVPAWYRGAVAARGLVLFPVTVNRKPVALIYADHDEAGRLRFAEGEMGLLKTLRNQAVLAVRQKSGA